MFYDDCDFPVWFAYFVIAQTFIILAMFAHFYVKAYLTPKKKLKVCSMLFIKETLIFSCNFAWIWSSSRALADECCDPRWGGTAPCPPDPRRGRAAPCPLDPEGSRCLTEGGLHYSRFPVQHQPRLILTINVPLFKKLRDIMFFLRDNHFFSHFKGHFEGAKTFLTP